MASSTMHGKIAHLTNVKQTLRSCGGAHGSWPAIVTPKRKNDNDKYGQSREKHGKTTRTLDIVKKQNEQTNSSHSSENTQGFDQKVSHWQSQNGHYNQSTCDMGKQPERPLQILNRYDFMQQSTLHDQEATPACDKFQVLQAWQSRCCVQPSEGHVHGSLSCDGFIVVSYGFQCYDTLFNCNLKTQNLKICTHYFFLSMATHLTCAFTRSHMLFKASRAEGCNSPKLHRSQQHSTQLSCLQSLAEPMVP